MRPPCLRRALARVPGAIRTADAQLGQGLAVLEGLTRDHAERWPWPSPPTMGTSKPVATAGLAPAEAAGDLVSLRHA